jgi:hypothetical protein
LNILRLPIFSVALIISVYAPSSIAATTDANPKGWLLNQKHTANGEQTIYVFPQRLRIENKHLGLTIVGDAQTGKVWLFNDNRKLSCCVNWNKFEHNFAKIMQMGGESLPHFKWVKPKDPKGPTVAGLTTTKFISSDEKLYFGGGGGGFISGGGKKIRVDYTIYVADKIQTSPRMLKVLAEMQTAPNLGGIPLQEISHYSDTNKKRMFLRTLSAKQIPNDKKLWEIPKYKQVAKQNDVASVTDAGFLEDMVSEW